MAAKRVAIVGQGVAGCSSALALLERFPGLSVTLFGHVPVEKTCSYGPAGLFRLDKYETREWAKTTFERFAMLERRYGPNTGIKLVSGHIQSDKRENLEHQERNMADIVYNFRWLTDRELDLLFENRSKFGIHYTAYASEGRRYVPWLFERLREHGAAFEEKEFHSLDEVAANGFDLVVNCAGMNAGRLSGDDDSVIPVRGVAFELDAPWHKHFHYRDFGTFTIPMTNSVIMGTLKQVGRSDMEITDADRKDIWDRYLQLHPTMKGAKVLSEFIHLRPERERIRVELEERRGADGRPFAVIHNYGHGSNGFTLSWGCASDVVRLAAPKLADKP